MLISSARSRISSVRICHACQFSTHNKSNVKTNSNFYKWRSPWKHSTSRKLEPDESPKQLYTRDTIHKVSGILRVSTWDSAQDQLNSFPIKWDSHIVCKVLKTHPPMEKAWLFFLWASRIHGFKHDQFTYTTMLDIFGEAGRIVSMTHLFREMEVKGIKIDAATYTALLHWLSKSGDFEGAVQMWDEMREKGHRPTVVSYTAFMKVLFDNGKPEVAGAIYREMLQVGLSPSCHTYTVLMEHLAGAGKFKAALDIMREMQEAGVYPDKAACNILIQKCSRAGEVSTMFQILQYMKEHKLVLRRPVFLEALEAFKLSNESDDLLREVNPHLALEGMEEVISDPESTFDISSCIDRDIIFNLLARRNFIAIEHILSGMIIKNTKLDSIILSIVVQANCMTNRLSGALMAFSCCKKMGQKLDKAAYTSLIGLLIRMNSFQEIIEVVEEMIKSVVDLGSYLVSILILRLGCAGMPAAATKIFHSLPNQQNTATYTALINTCFQTWDMNAAMELYTDMRREGIPASSGTFEVLINGLKGAGRIQEAEAYSKEKKRLKFTYHNKERISMEESLCDCLFDRG